MIIQTIDKLQDWLKTVKNVLEFDIETTGLEVTDIIVSIQLGNGVDQIFVPVDQIHCLNWTEVLPYIKPIFADKTIIKIAHNIKFDARVLARQGVQVAPPYYDTMVATALVFPDLRRKAGRGWKDKYALKALMKELFDEESPSYKEFLADNKIEYTVEKTLKSGKVKTVTKKRKPVNLTELPLDIQAGYALGDIIAPRKLKHYLDERMDVQTRFVFEEIEMKVLPILFRVEETGILIDQNRSKALKAKYDSAQDVLLDKVYEAAGKKFDIKKDDELRTLLYYDLRIPMYKTTAKTGKLSVDSDALSEFAERYPICQYVIDWRRYEKPLSNCLRPYPKYLKQDGRMHSEFGITATGRLTSSNPNLQNIPKRDDETKEIREIFVAKVGHKLLSYDYSQMEYRMVAHQANDQKLIRLVKADADLHARTALIGLGDATRRDEGKTINFATLFGQSAHTLARLLHIRYWEAVDIQKEILAEYPDVHTWFINTKEESNLSGWVETLLGRKRNLQAIYNNARSVANQALNTPIQGSCADLVKVAMIRWDSMRKKMGFKTELILQIHDELLFESPDEEVEIVKPYIQGVMESIRIVGDLVLKVPMSVECEVKSRWG